MMGILVNRYTSCVAVVINSKSREKKYTHFVPYCIGGQCHCMAVLIGNEGTKKHEWNLSGSVIHANTMARGVRGKI